MKGLGMRLRMAKNAYREAQEERQRNHLKAVKTKIEKAEAKAALREQEMKLAKLKKQNFDNSFLGRASKKVTGKLEGSGARAAAFNQRNTSVDNKNPFELGTPSWLKKEKEENRKPKSVTYRY